MCRPTTCKTCAKTTWAGCGQHIASVKAMVPKENWCPGASAHPDAAPTGFFAKLFGR